MGKTIYWIDDERDPKTHLPNRKKDDTVLWFKDYKTFVKHVIDFGLPDAVWFDHDLGNGKNGMDCASFMVDYCLDKGIPLPECGCQSQNPVGKENITKLIESYNKFYKENIEL
jgi:hypothetical protein